YAEGLAIQQQVVDARKQNRIDDTLLLLEHPPVLTLGRNAHRSNILASDEPLAQRGVELHETNRGGDVTYHGPGQLVSYPILDLTSYKRDVRWYVQSIEKAIIETLAEYGIHGEHVDGLTGVWTDVEGRQSKIAAIGVHISRWVTSHGFALNVDTDLTYFQYIVPCGLTKPVTSLRALGSRATRGEVILALAGNFGRVFSRSILTDKKHADINQARPTEPIQL